MVSQPRFYVYILARSNNKPFYVGKGQHDRVLDHESEARRGHKCHRCNIIRKIWKSGGEVQRYIIFTTDDESEAFAYECELIALHGRENLCNQTDGGEGASNPSKDVLDKRSASIRKALSTPEWITAQSERMKALWRNPELRAKRQATIAQRLKDPDLAAKRSASQKKRWADPEKRASTIAGQRSAEHPNASAGQRRRYENKKGNEHVGEN